MTDTLLTGLDDVLERVHVLAGRPRTVTRLSGGLTNENFKVVNDVGSFVVRVASPTSETLGIDRDHEFQNSVAAAESGIGASVIQFLPDDGVLVVEFLEGTTLTDANYAEPSMIQRVAVACRQLHQGPRFCSDFDMFERRRAYLRTVRTDGLRLPDRYLDYDETCARIERALRGTALPKVPCNNDLLAGNLIDTGESIRIIDYEYAGNNDPCFELGNLSAESGLDDDQIAALVHAYFGAESVAMAARTHLQSVVSRYGWTLWAAIQSARSTVEFDFWTWGIAKFDSAVSDMTSDRLENWLAQIHDA